MAASPVVRATVLNWLREISGDDVFYYQWEKTGQAVSPSYRPTWLPEDFVITDVQSKGAHDWWNFESQDDSATGLTCACFGPASNGIGTSLQDAQDIRKTVTIQGRTADYYDTGTTRLLVWEDAEGNLLYVSSSGDVEKAELMKVAQSMTPYRDASASYRLETVPEGYEPFWRYETCGAMQEEWIKDGTVLTWMYVTDPICWWQVPERASEALSIQGMGAQYWASEIPEEADDTVITVNGQTISGSQTVEVGGVSITSGTVHGVEESGILTWEDPESNTQFFIKGAVSKEELLEMAQSITSIALQKD